jgi:hypothetical protein
VGLASYYYPLAQTMGTCMLVVLSTLVNPVAQAADFHFAPVGGVMSSGYGWRYDPLTKAQRFHSGVDIAAPTGSPVYAPEAGMVVFSGQYGGYGEVVVLQHPSGLYTLYGHNSQRTVFTGQGVNRGQLIALVGSTGRATGPHLHFEVREGSQYINPLDYLTALENTGSANSIVTKPTVITNKQAETLLPSGGPELPINPENPVIEAKSFQQSTKKNSNNSWKVEVIKGSNSPITMQF